MQVKFKQWVCETEWTGLYIDGSIALKLVDADPEGFGEPIATATVCLWDPPPTRGSYNKEKQIWIKGWSENEGMYKCLVEAGVLEPCEHPQLWRAGHVMAELGTLTEASLEEVRKAKEAAGG